MNGITYFKVDVIKGSPLCTIRLWYKLKDQNGFNYYDFKCALELLSDSKTCSKAVWTEFKMRLKR
jgi:hypothetical protein